MTASTFADASLRPFPTPASVIAFFREQITTNGNPDLAGVEEEIIVTDREGRPLPHTRFQEMLGDLIRTLPNGEVIEGTSVHGGPIPVLCGRYDGGLVQPETNTTLVELAHAPRRSAWGVFEQSRSFTRQLMETASVHALRVMGGGVVPTITMNDLLEHNAVIPNSDFVYSWTHMTQGTRPEYCRTVFGTASIHHNMGFDDPERMARYITTALRLQPTMIAVLGNAPIWNNQRATADGSPLLSERSNAQIDYGHVYGMQDGLQYLYPDFLIDPQASFESIVNGYLDLPLDRTMAGDRKVFCNGMTMREYLANGLEVDGQTYYPDARALTMMLREPIVDVRPNFTGTAPRVETRAHDGVNQHMAVALDAFYRGISANLDEAHTLVSAISADEVRQARKMVCRQGMQTPLVHRRPDITTQQDMALSILAVAQRGLETRGMGEQALLSPLWILATSGRNPAQRLLSVYREAGRDMTAVLSAMRYDSESFADGESYAWPQRPERISTHTHQPRRAIGCCQ